MIIAISGLKFSGKDTIANYLVKKYNFARVSFADPLKDMVSKEFDVPRGWLDDPSKKEVPLITNPAPAADKFTETVSSFMVREFRTKGGFTADPAHTRVHDGILQTFTNEWENLYHTPRSLAILLGSSMRTGHSAFWVRKAILDIRTHIELGNPESFVISDLRYQSECKQLKDAFGDDLVTIRINRFDSSPSQDPSELDLVDYIHDFSVDNKGTIKELQGKVDELLNSWA
jgi:hypothetical protein